MGLLELILVAIALSMDAFAVGMTNGMTDSKMKLTKILLIAGFYGFFQFLMPVIGYFISGVFSDLIATIAPWVSFILLAFIGGKMAYDGVKEVLESKDTPLESLEQAEEGKLLKIGTLTMQAIATSIDALAVGVSLLALSTEGTLWGNIWLDSALIGCVTFTLSILAVYLGKLIGNKLADKAEIVGGVVLIIIGIKILLEGLL